MTPEQLFEGHQTAQHRFAMVKKLIDSIGANEMKVTKSQVAFRRKRGFAWLWRPGRYLHGEVAPLVLSVSLKAFSPSPRWKEVVEPSPGHFMHHLELWRADELDTQVKKWLKQAWLEAG